MMKTYTVQVTIFFETEVEARCAGDARQLATEEAICDDCFDTKIVDVYDHEPELLPGAMADIFGSKVQKAKELRNTYGFGVNTTHAYACPNSPLYNRTQ